MNKLYFECYSGISGDMTVAALLDIGADEAVLKKVLNSLPLKGFHIEISRVKKNGLDVCDFNVVLDKHNENHDHDMKYLYGDETGNRESVQPNHHSHEHRGFSEIMEIVEKADISEKARKLIYRIFTILGEAEAKAHGTTLDKVHFHEVGAVDSIVDITAVAVCLDNLGIEEVIIPVLYEGSGTIHCQHGNLPIPVPAVANIVTEHGIQLHLSGARGEYVTPTGAAIAAAIRTSDKLPDNFSVERIGMGAGKREQELSGILRVMLIKDVLPTYSEKDQIYKLESNIDDCSGEVLGHVMQCLLEAGARDVQYSPVYMKKSRPAYMLTVICMEEDIPTMQDIIFNETTTIGIRRVKMERSILKRKIETIHTSIGKARVKIVMVPQSCREHMSEIVITKRCYPEYDSVIELCKIKGKSYQEVYDLIVKEASET